MSAVRCIQVHPKLGPRRLTRIAFDGIFVYLKADRRSHNKVQVWRVNTVVPDDWACVFEYDVAELYYSIAGYSYIEKAIYVLIVALFKDEEVPRVSLMKRIGDTFQEWDLDPVTGVEFESVPLENATLGVGKDRLHIFDRSIVQGAIPFWYLTLEEESFSVKRQDLLDAEDVKCSRFAVCLDGDSRKFARLREDNQIAVYDGSIDEWISYSQSSASDYDLHELSAVRGLRETFGRAGKRVGAVESPLTIYADGPICVAKRVDHNCHRFYQLTFDDDKREFTLRQRGAASLKGVAKMCYVLVTDRMAAVVGLGRVAVVPLQPPPLSHIALWSLQKHTATTDEFGALSGGLSEQAVKSILKLADKRPLVK